jgi:hypothetical protein
MSWIRFEGERDFVDLLLVCEKEGLLRLGEHYLVLVQPHSIPCKDCYDFLLGLIDTLNNTAEIKTHLLMVTESFQRSAIFEPKEVILLPPQLPFSNRMKNILEKFSFDVSLFLFDPYGSLWFAWVGDEFNQISLAKETTGWLSYLDIQCPE